MRSIFSRSSLLRHQRGFTLIELLAFVAIFSISIVGFIAVLVAVVRIQVRQGASTEVTSQSQFLLRSIQRSVEQSMAVDLPSDVTTTTLRLRTSSTTDPTLIYLSSGVMYVQEAGGTPQRLTSNRVQVSDVTFTKRANSGGKDLVAVNFTISFNSTNPQQMLSQFIDTSVARVSAATFDSDIRASSTNTYKLGAASREWQSINNTIFFGASSNVGINTTPASATVMFQVSGGDMAVSDAAKGLILRNSNNVCVRLYYTTTGKIATSSLSCPP